MADYDTFEWDEAKRQATIAKHGLDFAMAVRIFADRPLILRSLRGDEMRWLAIGRIEGRWIAIVFTRRGHRIRIITARKARDDEREAFDADDTG